MTCCEVWAGFIADDRSPESGMTVAEPDDSVFTTIRWDGKTGVTHFLFHLERLQAHAERMGITWPEGAEKLAIIALTTAFEEFDGPSLELKDGRVHLVRLRLERGGGMSAQCRTTTRSEQISTSAEGVLTSRATALPAPRWSGATTGCKHGQWQPYHDASEMAAERGCGIALLVHDDAIVDANSSTPLLLDADGVAWFPDPNLGAVESITLAAMLPHLTASGVPVMRGRLTRTLVARAKSMVVVGSGAGVIQISEIDGQSIGDASNDFAISCTNIHNQTIQDGWTEISEVAP